MTEHDLIRITRWYSGKALNVITSYVIPTLLEAQQLECWPKGASRKVRAALNKMGPAKSWAIKHIGTYTSSNYLHDDYKSGAWSAMFFGKFEDAPTLLETYKSNDGAIRDWAQDFAPVATLIERLDATRPKPVVVLGTLSRTVLENVGRSIGVDLNTIRSPEIEYHQVQRMMKIGGKLQEVIVWIPVIKWPEGTRHNVSKFISTDRHDQCQACGHAIKNVFNWVPLLADTTIGPVSLWVGRDCAEKLFGCDVSGEADWSAAKAAR